MRYVLFCFFCNEFILLKFITNHHKVRCREHFPFQVRILHLQKFCLSYVCSTIFRMQGDFCQKDHRHSCYQSELRRCLGSCGSIHCLQDLRSNIRNMKGQWLFHLHGWIILVWRQVLLHKFLIDTNSRSSIIMLRT